MKSKSSPNTSAVHRAPNANFRSASKLVLAAGISLLAINASDAALRITFDLRPVAIGAVNPLNVSSSNVGISNHAVTVGDTTGATIVFDLYATFNETVATDNFQKVQGALISKGTTGGLSGAVTAAFLPALLSDGPSGAQVGANGGDLSNLYDPNHGLLNGALVTATNSYPAANVGQADGITDWGDTVVNRNLTPGKWFVAGTASSVPLDATNSVLLGEFKMTITPGSSGTTTMDFFVRPKGTSTSNSSILAINYNTANLTLNYTGNSTNVTAPNDNYAFLGSTINVIAVPEPSAFGMVLIGALGLVGIRRAGLRRF